jgi:hypothetical protein
MARRRNGECVNIGTGLDVRCLGQAATMTVQGEIGLKKRVLLALICLTSVCVLCVGPSEAQTVRPMEPIPVSLAPGEYEVVKTEYRIHAGMYVSFRRVIGKAVTDSKWQVTVQSSEYPKWVEIGWVWPRSDGTAPTPTVRKLTGLERGRTFGPLYGGNDPEETDWTAPWLSREVLRELRTGRVAYNFKMGTFSLTGVLADDLRVEEEVLYPIDLNGRRVYLPAYKCAKGQIVVWNNIENPLVLEYKPFGIPLITGVFGWKAEAISVRGGQL